MEITAGKVLKYTLLPGFVPRTQEFFSSGFAHVAAFTALALRTAGLIPYNHPYLNPANIGRFGIRQALGEARRHLVFRRENMDQVIIYYTIMLGISLIFFQFIMLALSLTFHTASAAAFGPWVGTFFVTPNPAGDVAFMFLDWVFGYQNLYGSCVDPAIACPTVPGPFGVPIQLHGNTQLAKTAAYGMYQWPSPFHKGLHMLFNFYDLGVAAVGMIMLTYMVTTVTAETAQSGIPFGKRFNKTWVLPRLVLACILLFPWNRTPGTSTWDNGSYLNGAQTITLFVAKWGSSLATNGWILFNNNLIGSTLAGTNQNNLVGKPNPPAYNILLEFMLVALTCKYAEERIAQEAGQPAVSITPWQLKYNLAPPPPLQAVAMPTGMGGPGYAGFTAALGNSLGFDIIIIFGDRRPNEYIREVDGLKPVCGRITIHVTDLVPNTGAYAVQGEYYDMIERLWNDANFNTFARQIVDRYTPGPDKDPNAPLPTAAFINTAKTNMNTWMNNAVNAGRAAAAADPRWVAAMMELGWAGAAVWYNKISEMNGSYIGSVYNLPSPDMYPELMEYIKNQRKAHNSDDSGVERYKPVLADNTFMFYRRPGEDSMAMALWYAQSVWIDQYPKSVGSPAADFIRAIFGLQGLYNMLDNRDTHPLAKLVAVGKSLMEACAIQMMGRVGFGLVSLAAGAQSTWGAMARNISDTLASVSQVTFMIGAVLYYVVPFLPFVYFFFAASAWIKAIFEAMVGMPLWALSFVRIDGDGLPGKSGMNGFYLLLDILIRPILIIFSLLASISIFSAQVTVLGEIWYLVETNIGGGDTANATALGTAGETGAIEFTRDSIEGFFYTVIYTIIVYMLGMASFKLVDLIPSKILRWMGASVNTIGVDGDAGHELMQTGEGLIQQSYAAFNSGIFSLLTRNSGP